MTAIINGKSPTCSLTGEASPGLTGVQNSTDYRVAEIERHLHGAGRWIESAATPTATHKADMIGAGGGAFQIDAGNDTWGAWVQILGSEDTPIRTDQLYFDPHEILIEGTERTATYFVQITRGASGEAGYSAGLYTEIVYSADTNKYTGILPFQTGRAPAGSLLWARCMVPSVDTGTMDFYLGIHEYEG